MSAVKCNSGAGFLLPFGCRKMLFYLSKNFGNSFVTPSLHTLTVVQGLIDHVMLSRVKQMVLYSGYAMHSGKRYVVRLSKKNHKHDLIHKTVAPNCSFHSCDQVLSIFGV